MQEEIVLVVTLGLTGVANAQSFNIDIHDAEGTPSAGYAAAAGAGQWNSFTADAGDPMSLFGLDGIATTVTLTHDGSGFQRTSTQTTTGDDSALLRDYLFSVGPAMTLEFEGLLDGTYDLFTFAYFHEDYDTPTDVWVNGDTDTTQSVIGRFENGFVEGMSHARHRVQVLDGLLSVTVDNTGDPLVNGLQLVQLPAPPVLATLLPLVIQRRRRRGVGAGPRLQ